MPSTIYTSAGTRKGQVTPLNFKDYGNDNQVPCPVTESGVVALPRWIGPRFSLFVTSLPAIISASHQQKEIQGTGPQDLCPNLMGIRNEPLLAPQVVISFGGRENMDKVEAAMLSNDFRKEIQARQSLYKGQATPEICHLAISHSRSVSGSLSHTQRRWIWPRHPADEAYYYVLIEQCIVASVLPLYVEYHLFAPHSLERSTATWEARQGNIRSTE